MRDPCRADLGQQHQNRPNPQNGGWMCHDVDPNPAPESCPSICRIPPTPVTLIAQNALFYGFHGRRGAMADGAVHPVVVLSHGSGGNAERLGWIASDLAARGFIVAAVDHAGTTSQDSLPSRRIQPWERGGDVSDILDYLEKSPP